MSKVRASQGESRLDKALRVTSNFIERLYEIAKRGVRPGGTDTWIEFDGRALSSMGLNDGDHERYRECVELLLSAVGGKPNARTISSDAVETLFRAAVIRAVRPLSRGRWRERAAFVRHMRRELRTLRSKLASPLRSWQVAVQVQGWEADTLPFTFGGVQFEAGSESLGNRLASRITSYQPRRRTSQARIEKEERGRTSARAELAGAFAKEACGLVRVRAADSMAAKRLGIARVRQTVDVLNFFYPLFDTFTRSRRAFVGPDGPRSPCTWVVHGDDGEEMRWQPPFRSELPAVGFRIDTEKSIASGAARANHLMLLSQPTDLEERIVRALTWAGRATVEHRRDEAFLLFAIALESLLTKSSARTGVTDRLRLRVAHLLGATPGGRKRISDLVSKLYDLRSALVHSGDSGSLAKADLESMSRLVRRTLVVALTDKRFTAMRTGEQFDAWCDAQLLGGAENEARAPG